ncbi:MAG TPA: hypothetical protein DCE42_23745 [Myxococcales bacterium]|nr:hypothetical protein [Deltaproteobacteria bacterium]MBU54280.1 hypothetical protein [Deltaproteobacteria bacterium]HAA57801.1 hypothetical protein [Myxococcales bacterium]|tara:strand:- start:1200 stop:1433 length:234 start_codon:yes stop_codon:yes gene_type:complete
MVKALGKTVVVLTLKTLKSMAVVICVGNVYINDLDQVFVVYSGQSHWVTGVQLGILQCHPYHFVENEKKMVELWKTI